MPRLMVPPRRRVRGQKAATAAVVPEPERHGAHPATPLGSVSRRQRTDDTPGFRRAFWLGAAILGLVVLPTMPQAGEPPVYALVGGRIVPVVGIPLEKGTVLIRHGLIEAVGANLPVPADARVLDASKLTIYPGLIDASSDAALDEAAPAQTPAGGRGGARPAAPAGAAQAPSGSPEERQGLTPYLHVADIINAGSRRIESSRNAGITAALITPRRGYFQGTSALVSLSGAGAGEMVVKPSVAQHIGLQTGGGSGGYPSSLMGVFAFVKQTLSDAQRYGQAWRTYNEHPGSERPSYSRALEALQPVVKGQFPVVLHADTPVEIDRALRLAEAFALNPIISGALEASRSAALLKERKVPVILSAKYPERDRDADPESQEELRALRRRVDAPATAVALARAGVQFAFSTGDMANPRDLLQNVARSVEAGLDRYVALRALTLAPAEIFGVADRLGTIEKGKAANLVVATGDLFDPRTRIREVFVDGIRFEVPETEAPRVPGAPGRPTGGGAEGSGR